MRFLPTHRCASAARIGAVLLLGAVGGWFSHARFATPSAAQFRGTQLRESDAGYTFISPLLLCDVGTQDAFPEIQPIKNMLQSLIATKEQGSTQSVSVYVRSMKGGRWFSLGADTKYAPASMLKVFVMLAYYKEAETNPSVLDRSVVFQGSSNPADDMPGEKIPHLQSGTSYSLRAVIRQMIVYSDNDALNTLVDNFDAKTLESFSGIFTDLNIPPPTANTESSLDFMTVSQYASVYRVLYSGTYLAHNYSEDVLKLLSQTSYQDGIVAGVPDGLPVSHKFGVREVAATAGAPVQDELHDCGIVYYPNHPYLLCVMTRGSNFIDLQQDLRDISHATYQGLDAFYKTLPPPSTTTKS